VTPADETRPRCNLFVVLALVLGLCVALAAPAHAVDESIACFAETTDMTIAYGHVVSCAINVLGDSDIFRFFGRAGQHVVVQVTRVTGGTPCLDLFNPDASQVGAQVCNATAARIDTVLTQTGTYSMTVSEQANNATMDYTLALESVTPRSPVFTQGLEYGALAFSDAINPVGDLDLLAFRATAGDQITLTITQQSGGTPCVELFAPNGSAVGVQVCNAASAVIATTLAQTGTYTALVSEQGNDAVLGYSAVVTCAVGTCGTPTTNETIGVFRPSTNNFFLRNSNNPAGPVLPDFILPFGAANDIPLVGDFDGNGTTTIALYRPSTATFYLRNSNTQGWPDITVPFGAVGDIPLVGDWDGNGTFTIGVYRPSTATFYLRNTNTTGAPDLTIPFGAPGGNDIPVVGDWDGNNTTTIGIYRPSDNTFYLRNSNTAGGADHIVLFGASGDLPVVGDWDGNGTTTVGLYRQSTATFYLHNSNVVEGAVTPDITLQFGTNGDLPLAGHWGPLSNVAPVAVNDAFTTRNDVVKTGDVLSANPTTPDTDADGDLMTVIAVNGSAANVGTQITLPVSNAKLTLNANGTFSYDPNSTVATSDSFTYTISDPKGATATATVNFTIQPNNPPVITEGASVGVTMDEDGNPTAFSLTLNATDADGDTITWSISTPAANGNATASGTGASKAIGYTPNANHNGSDSFVVQVADGHGGTDTITVNVTINAINDPPSFTLAGNPPAVNEDAGAQSVLNFATSISAGPANEAGQTLTFNVTGNGNPSLFAVAGAPAIDATTGTLTYTPAANQNGTALITVVLQDSGSNVAPNSNTSPPQQFTITVNAVNDPPSSPPAELHAGRQPGGGERGRRGPVGAELRDQHQPRGAQ